MFNFFKKQKGMSIAETEELMVKIFSLLPDQFIAIRNQLAEGILYNFKRTDLHYTKFSLKTDLLNKYENKKSKCFEIRGIRVFDIALQIYTEISIDIAYDLLLGYSSPQANELIPDTNKIDVKKYWLKRFDNEEFEEIKSMFNKDEVKLINANDVYKVELNNNIYYHLKDLQDGDFIGIDKTKNIFKITHDPFKISSLEGKLVEIL